MIENFGCGGKKVNRVNISLTNKQHSKLSKLATSCNLKPTTLAAMLIDHCLNSPELVTSLQDEYGIHNAYRVVPVQHKGEIIYTLNERVPAHGMD